MNDWKFTSIKLKFKSTALFTFWKLVKFALNSRVCSDNDVMLENVHSLENNGSGL